MASCGFDTLFTKARPHILEMICFFLDYESFKTCLDVSKGWREVLTSESSINRVKSVFSVAILDDHAKLHLVSEEGNEEEARKLVSSGMVNLNCGQGSEWSYCHISLIATPLISAARAGHDDIVKLFLDRGAQVNGRDRLRNTPLLSAVTAVHGDVGVVKLLLDRGADPNKAKDYGCTPLHRAAATGQRDVAKLLLDSGAEIDKTDASGNTPLLCAVRDGPKDVAQLLLDRGAEVDKSDFTGRSPLLWAAWKGNTDAAKLLLDRGAEIDKTNESGKTPLHKAASKWNKSMVKLLIDRGAEVDKMDSGGVSPLLKVLNRSSWPEDRDMVEVVELLVGGGGADPNMKTQRTGVLGDTPLSIARANSLIHKSSSTLRTIVTILEGAAQICQSL